MIQLNWDDVYNCRPTFDYDYIHLNTLRIPGDEMIDFGARVGSVNVRELMQLVHRPFHFQLENYQPQLAILVFAAARQVHALDTYFPLVRTLNATEQRDFYRLAGRIVRHPHFDARIIGISKEKWTENLPEIVFFLACHIAEIFFNRQDILERLLNAKFQIRLYTSQPAFMQESGVAGGNYNPERGFIQMMLSRLFEGYNGKSPGVAPFLHEFGHLLDHFDAAEGELGKSKGTLPGMRPEEGALYNAEAHNLFQKGKKLEWERYTKLSIDGYQDGDPFPIGHPYVFQNDTEFIAGYFEMFFRNPHYFAAQNPDLYESFRLTFQQDPRQAWAADFPFYIEQNQSYYRGLQRPPKPGLTI